MARAVEPERERGGEGRVYIRGCDKVSMDERVRVCMSGEYDAVCMRVYVRVCVRVVCMIGCVEEGLRWTMDRYRLV